MKPIFRNEDQQTTFEHDGFVVLDHFLDAEQVKYFKKLVRDGIKKENLAYAEVAEQVDLDDEAFLTAGWDVTLGIKNLAIQRLITTEIATLVERSLEAHLTIPYKCPFAFGAIKQAMGGKAGGGEVSAHNHLSNMNQSLCDYPEISMFIPLDDIDESMGPVSFIKGSHKLWEDRVQSQSTWLTENSYKKLKATIDEYWSPTYPKAGQAVLFHSRNIHAGAKVGDGQERISMTADLIPADQEYLWYFANYDDAGRVKSVHGTQVFDLPLYFRSDVSTLPKNRTGAELHTLDPYEIPEFTEQEFRAACYK